MNKKKDNKEDAILFLNNKKKNINFNRIQNTQAIFLVFFSVSFIELVLASLLEFCFKYSFVLLYIVCISISFRVSHSAETMLLLNCIVCIVGIVDGNCELHLS